MKVHTICPHCGRRLRVKNEYVGHRAQCPNCFCPFVVTISDTQASETLSQPIHDEVEPRFDDNTPPPLRGQTVVDAREEHDKTAKSADLVRTNVLQGAVIGGWVCFALAVVLMLISLWTVFIFGPLLLASFILSIIAMAQKRILGGVVLLLCTIVVPPIVVAAAFLDVIREIPPVREARSAVQKAKEQATASPVAVAGRSDQPEVGRNEKTVGNFPLPADEWSDAKNAVQVGSAQVRVTRVAIENVRVKSIMEDAAESKNRLFQISLRITNVDSARKIDYRGWQGNTFSSDAALSDDIANQYKAVSFGFGDRIVGQVTSKSVYPGESVEDLLVFEPPVDAAKYLNLELPGSNIGATGKIRLRIPRQMIGN